MHRFRKSLVGLVGLLVLVIASAALMPLAGLGQGGNPLTRDPRKSYYLTQTRRTGGQAPTACAAGYHMAALWEIHDSSNLSYDTQLGLTFSGSNVGSGPPVTYGWIRTGSSTSLNDLHGGLTATRGRVRSTMFGSKHVLGLWSSNSRRD